MKRKVIQLSVAVDETGGEAGSVMTALCDDGTMWINWYGREWVRLPPIPQPETERRR